MQNIYQSLNAATIVAFNAWGNALEVLIYDRLLFQSYIVQCAIGATCSGRMNHCIIATLLHCYIATLLHCYIATLLQCYIEIGGQPTAANNQNYITTSRFSNTLSKSGGSRQLRQQKLHNYRQIFTSTIKNWGQPTAQTAKTT